MIKYSVVVPVYNRPNETEELLESLSNQAFKNFEVIIIEDGSSETSEHIVNSYSDQLTINYHFKPNTGPSDSRNLGMSMAKGEYIIFFDSDCVIPAGYFNEVEKYLAEHDLDAFGGPDTADQSFSIIQKAINYAMTSIFTTGGIRGKKNKLDTYQPRSFNMGIKKEVYENVGGFSDIHPGEDPDLSYRIMDAGYKVGLIEDAVVYHKRRIDFSKFTKQVYKFGIVRPILIKWHPKKFKVTYLFPSVFLVASISQLLMGNLVTRYAELPLTIFMLVILIDALIKTKNIAIAVLAVLASFIQLWGYGFGFLKSSFFLFFLRKDEREVFKDFFYEEKRLKLSDTPSL